MTEAKLKKAIKDRCKQCQCDEEDTEICKGCVLNKPKNLERAIMSYCKDCHGGNGLDYCGSEDFCPIYKVIIPLKKEVTEKLQGKKNESVG